MIALLAASGAAAARGTGMSIVRRLSGTRASWPASRVAAAALPLRGRRAAGRGPRCRWASWCRAPRADPTTPRSWPGGATGSASALVSRFGFQPAQIVQLVDETARDSGTPATADNVRKAFADAARQREHEGRPRARRPARPRHLRRRAGQVQPRRARPDGRRLGGDAHGRARAHRGREHHRGERAVPRSAGRARARRDHRDRNRRRSVTPPSFPTTSPSRWPTPPPTSTRTAARRCGNSLPRPAAAWPGTTASARSSRPNAPF